MGKIARYFYLPKAKFFYEFGSTTFSVDFVCKWNNILQRQRIIIHSGNYESIMND
jgi:hypothetical protein